MIDQRNQYGYPVIDKYEAARQYAAQAKERNAPKCDCATCREIELLPAVQRITQRWKS